MDTWKDRSTGVDRSAPVIVVDQLDLLGSKRDAEVAAMNSDPGHF